MSIIWSLLLERGGFYIFSPWTIRASFYQVYQLWISLSNTFDQMWKRHLKSEVFHVFYTLPKTTRYEEKLILHLTTTLNEGHDLKEHWLLKIILSKSCQSLWLFFCFFGLAWHLLEFLVSVMNTIELNVIWRTFASLIQCAIVYPLANPYWDFCFRYSVLTNIHSRKTNHAIFPPPPLK